MAGQTEGPDVAKVAFAAALADRNDVVRVPETFPVYGFQAPIVEHQGPACATRALQPAQRLQCVDAANGASATVAREDPLAKISWIGAEPPFMHAPVGTECATAPWNFDGAPSAQSTALRPRWKLGAEGASAGHGSLRAHDGTRANMDFPGPVAVWSNH